MKGRRQVGAITSAEHGQLVTVEICMNATGSFVPPLFVFPRTRMKPELMDGTPNGSISACHKSGWMQMEIFTQWFEHFVRVTGASQNNPMLLILDGHSTHTTNINVINLARDKGVHILCLPPHCSHRLQPLDVSFMKPLSTYYTQAIECWLRNHPGRTVTVFQVAGLFNQAYLKAATAQVAASGFRKTGIYPVNRHVFQDYEFKPAAVTEKPLDPAHQGQPADDQIAQGQPTNARIAQEQPADNQIAQGQPTNDQIAPKQPADQIAQGQPINGQIAQKQPGDDRIAQGEPTNDQIAPKQPADQIAQGQPINGQIAQKQPGDDQIAQGQPTNARIAQDQPTDGQIAQEPISGQIAPDQPTDIQIDQDHPINEEIAESRD